MRTARIKRCCKPTCSSMNQALLFSVFVVASCGLAYELIAGALSSYLLGDSVMQFSTVIGTYLFANLADIVAFYALVQQGMSNGIILSSVGS